MTSSIPQDERSEGDAAVPVPPPALCRVTRRGRPHRPPVRAHAPPHGTHRIPLQVRLIFNMHITIWDHKSTMWGVPSFVI